MKRSIRALCEASGVPYVMENVRAAQHNAGGKPCPSKSRQPLPAGEQKEQERMTDCVTCGDKGFALNGDGDVEPCPRCNPDSGYEPGEYLAELITHFGRCEATRGGGGRQCYLQKGHREKHHAFMCGR